MKLAIFGGLSLLALAVAVSPAAAVPPALTTTRIASVTTEQLTPFELVHLAERGYFRNQGIPSYGAFMFEIEAGRVTPESLVQAGIRSNVIRPETLSDRSYLNAVYAGLIDILSVD